MRKQKLILMSISFLIMIMSLSMVVYAWFTIVERTQEIIIFSGKIETSATLYEIKSDNTRTEITNSYEFMDVIPGDQFNFVLKIKNEGTIPGTLLVKTDFVILEELKPFFEFSYGLDENNLTLGSITQSVTMINKISIISKEEVNLYFSVKVKTDLTKEDYEELTSKFLKIDKITISIEQKE